MTSDRFCVPQRFSTSAKAKGKVVPGEVGCFSSPLLLSIEERQRIWPAARGSRAGGKTGDEVANERLSVAGLLRHAGRVTWSKMFNSNSGGHVYTFHYCP